MIAWNLISQAIDLPKITMIESTGYIAIWAIADLLIFGAKRK